MQGCFAFSFSCRWVNPVFSSALNEFINSEPWPVSMQEHLGKWLGHKVPYFDLLVNVLRAPKVCWNMLKQLEFETQQDPNEWPSGIYGHIFFLLFQMQRPLKDLSFRSMPLLEFHCQKLLKNSERPRGQDQHWWTICKEFQWAMVMLPLSRLEASDHGNVGWQGVERGKKADGPGWVC